MPMTKREQAAFQAATHAAEALYALRWTSNKRVEPDVVPDDGPVEG